MPRFTSTFQFCIVLRAHYLTKTLLRVLEKTLISQIVTTWQPFEKHSLSQYPNTPSPGHMSYALHSAFIAAAKRCVNRNGGHLSILQILVEADSFDYWMCSVPPPQGQYQALSLTVRLCAMLFELPGARTPLDTNDAKVNGLNPHRGVGNKMRTTFEISTKLHQFRTLWMCSLCKSQRQRKTIT